MKIKIIHRKLGREQAHGIAESDGVVYIDSRLKGKKLFVHSSPSLKRWGFLYIFGFHIGELRFNPRYFHSGGFL